MNQLSATFRGEEGNKKQHGMHIKTFRHLDTQVSTLVIGGDWVTQIHNTSLMIHKVNAPHVTRLPMQVPSQVCLCKVSWNSRCFGTYLALPCLRSHKSPDPLVNKKDEQRQFLRCKAARGCKADTMLEYSVRPRQRELTWVWHYIHRTTWSQWVLDDTRSLQVAKAWLYAKWKSYSTYVLSKLNSTVREILGKFCQRACPQNVEYDKWDADMIWTYSIAHARTTPTSPTW